MIRILLVSVMFFLSIYADDVLLTPREQAILKTVLRVDGYINEELYNDFWKELRPRVKKSDLDKIREFLLNEAVNTQLILWGCVKKSISEKKTCKSKKYIAILNKMKKNGQMIAYNNTINLMEAAATGKAFEKNGQKMFITTKMANKILAGIKGSIQRARLLLSNKWQKSIK